MPREIRRGQYADIYGPTVGDRVRLGDTELIIEVEKDLTTPGDEAVFGGGKVLRVGMGQQGTLTREDPRVPDTVITNALIVDYTGIYKADVAIRDGRISAIGHAGNPETMVGVTIPVAASTDIISGENKILTAGGVDTHIHFVSPDQVNTALYSGVTTMIGGGTGPSESTRATTVTPGAWHIHQMLRAAEGLPVNLGFLGKGHATDRAPLDEQIRAGAIGLKVHEDWGAIPQTIDLSLSCADEFDVQVAVHTDTLNEAGFVEDTRDAIAGRVIHTFHTEGAGGGHAPDIIRLAGEPNVLPASTNPTLPYTRNTVEEHLDMLMVCHHLHPDLPEDVAFADSRIRPETIAAEDVLHDLGVFSITSSDSQAMGRVGEVITRTWQVADAMKRQRGPLPGDENADNLRVRRYVAKYTINPSLAQGIAHEVGSVEVGKLADLVLWEPKFFGVRPDMIVKGGHLSVAAIGDPNASIPTPQPVFLRPQFGVYGTALANTCVTFMSEAAITAGVAEEIGLQRRVVGCHGIRSLRKKDLPLNGLTPTIEVDPQTYEVRVDGKPVTCEANDILPLAQLYHLF